MGIGAFLRQIVWYPGLKKFSEEIQATWKPVYFYLIMVRTSSLSCQPYYFSYPTIMSIFLCGSLNFHCSIHCVNEWCVTMPSPVLHQICWLCGWLQLYFFHSNPTCICRIRPQSLNQRSNNEWAISTYSRFFYFSRGPFYCFDQACHSLYHCTPFWDLIFVL